jgi:hypothetical protein
MDESFDPVIQLKALLGDKPNHPWGALIPQVLLWCFTRFCIDKLVDISDTLLIDNLWDDHLELIHQHAPKGLESVSASWFTPENIEHVHSSLEEYNRFFMEILVVIDTVVRDSDSDAENRIAEFLDVDMKYAIKEWLGEEFKSFLIFPMDDSADDEFTDEQFNKLLDALMKFMSDNPPPSEPAAELVPEAVPEVPTVPEAVPEVPTVPVPVPVPEVPPYLFAQYAPIVIERRKTRSALKKRVLRVKTRRIR